MRAIHLRTEYLQKPLGIDIIRPRFYWHCEGGTLQTAYRIIARRGGDVIWDSGKTESSAMTHILYDGAALQSRDRVYWSVCLWDENDRAGVWSETWFELGLLEAADWKAQWISGNYTPEKHKRYPVDCFKKFFPVKKELVKARLYMTACGIYEAMINRTKVDGFCLAPGCTDYRKRLQYQTYDVTGLIETSNTLEIQLADGWYRGSIGCFGSTNVYGRKTKLLCQLELNYADGTMERIVSDRSFSWSNDGPYLFTDLKDGEIYDAGLAPSYSGESCVVGESKTLVASNNVQPAAKEELRAKLLVTRENHKVLDFGQNIAGFVSFTICGQKGQRVRLRMGELLDENGEFTQKNMQQMKPVNEIDKSEEILLIMGQYEQIKGEMQQTPKQEIIFTCSGHEDHYKTTFAVFGFRYILVETEAEFQAENFKAIAVYSNMEQTGNFICSNEKINRFLENTRWSMKGNFLDIPTDCPTRERLGWTGDAQVFFNTGAYLMDVAAFFRKWMLDMEDGKMNHGVVPSVVPYAGMDMMYSQTGASVGWGDAAVYLPYRYWKRYGDRRFLEDTYTMSRDYAMYAIGNTGHEDEKEAKANPYNQYVYEKGRHLGEWLEPKAFNDSISAGVQLKQTEVATAYFHFSMACMAEIAGALGKSADEILFRDYEEGSKRAYNYLFLSKGSPDTDRQAKLVRPLAMGLVEGELKKAIQDRLVKAVLNRQCHIGTGFLSTPFILPVLSAAGHTELAYKMLENEEAPGWLYEVDQGATTVWEDWEGHGSHNHYSPGAACQWLFDTVAGIQIDGENHFRIHPIPGGSLSYAQASYESLYGTVKSAWQKSPEGIVYTVHIPANTTAEILVPGSSVRTVCAGHYSFMETDADIETASAEAFRVAEE